jgi:mono/diheme cytochrome c family protein
MSRVPRPLAAAIVVAAVLCGWAVTPEAAADAQVARGKYLLTFGGCVDCPTPSYSLGKPDMARFLGGSDVGFFLPGAGTFYSPNLTPDKETGLGAWTRQQIVTALQTGVRPDGRILAPIMPWRAFAKLTRSDVQAIAAYLKSLPPVRKNAPGPFGPDEMPTSFAMKVVPPQEVVPR